MDLFDKIHNKLLVKCMLVSNVNRVNEKKPELVHGRCRVQPVVSIHMAETASL